MKILFRARPANLSKALDYLSHELVVAKLIVYGLEIEAVCLIYPYVVNRKQ